MIVVYTTDEDSHDHPDATRFSTDEHNNLCVFEGKSGDRLRAVFLAGFWLRVEVEEDDDSG